MVFGLVFSATFVIRSQQGKAEWVTIRRGVAAGELVEVYGPLKPGDLVLKRASDEIREGTALATSAANNRQWRRPIKTSFQSGHERCRLMGLGLC